MSVKLEELKQSGARYGEKRRGRRMNSRVKVRLAWEDDKANRQEFETVTRIVNPYGCMAVLPHSFEVDQRFALTNLATDASYIAVVVWKGQKQPDGWEYGIELVAPDLDFWGLEL